MPLPPFFSFKNQAELQLGFPLKTLQSDWGVEYRAFTTFLTNNGIIHKTSCFRTHEQNGVVERKHRHIVDHGLALFA